MSPPAREILRQYGPASPPELRGRAACCNQSSGPNVEGSVSFPRSRRTYHDDLLPDAVVYSVYFISNRLALRAG